MSTTTFSPALIAAPARRAGQSSPWLATIGRGLRALARIDAYAVIEASIGLATLSAATAFVAAAW